MEGIRVPGNIGSEAMVKNKGAAGRPQGLVDVASLEVAAKPTVRRTKSKKKRAAKRKQS